MLTEDWSIYAKVAIWGSLAGAGGAAKFISSVLRNSQSISQRRFCVLLLANMFVSSFAGLMGGLIATTMTHDATWPYIASGLFGYLGTQGMDILLLALKKKIEPVVPFNVGTVIPMPPSVDPSSSPAQA